MSGYGQRPGDFPQRAPRNFLVIGTGSRPLSGLNLIEMGQVLVEGRISQADIDREIAARRADNARMSAPSPWGGPKYFADTNTNTASGVPGVGDDSDD